MIEGETKLSQTEIAEKSGLTRQFVNNFFRGRLNNPTLETINKIATASGVTLMLVASKLAEQYYNGNTSNTNDNV